MQTNSSSSSTTNSSSTSSVASNFLIASDAVEADLTKKKLKDDHIEDFLNQSGTFLNLQVLVLSQNKLTSKTLKHLAPHLGPEGKLAGVRSLDLSQNRIYYSRDFVNNKIELFVNALVANNGLESLSLAYNKMPWDAEKNFARLLQMTSLKELHVSGNYLSGDEIGAALIENTSLRVLRMGDCSLNPETGRVLLSRSLIHPSLIFCNLRSNSLGGYIKEGINLRSVVYKLVTYFPPSFFDDTLVQQVASSTNLGTLSLEKTGLKAVDVTLLAFGLRENRVIHSLFLSSNKKIGDQAGAHLLETLLQREAHLLRDFRAFSCRFGPVVASRLPTFIRTNQCLRLVNLLKNFKRENVAPFEEEIINAVGANPSLLRLKLDKGILSEEGESKLHELCEKHLKWRGKNKRLEEANQQITLVMRITHFLQKNQPQS